MNATRAKKLRLLYEDNSDPYTKEELDALWVVYRMGKIWACAGDVFEHVAAFKLENQAYEVVSDIKEEQPRQGAVYWTETIERPNWFAVREIY